MSTASPDPTDVGPAAGGNHAATDADRDHVVTLVSEAHNEGLLSRDERDRRIAAARTAATFDDLVPLTRDLVSADGRIVRPAPAVQVDAADPTQAADQVIAIFSGTERKGNWRARPNTSVLAVFGGAKLDLTEATFEAHTITINCFCLFGGVEVKVPHGVAVTNQAFGIFGGADVKVTPPQPGAPVVILKGVALFGGLEVRNPKLKKRRG